MFFIELSTTDNLIVQKLTFKNAYYNITVRHCDDLQEFERQKFCTRDDSFIAHITGRDINVHAELYMGNDLSWHCDDKTLSQAMVTEVGKMIDNHFL